MDLSAIAYGDSAEFELVHPETREPLGVFYTMLGPEHELRRSHRIETQRQARREFEAFSRGKKALKVPDPLDDQEEMTEYLTKIITGWRYETKDKVDGQDKPVVTDHPGKFPFGEDLDCNPANIRKVATSVPQSWIRKQWVQRVNDDEGFIRSSSAS